MKLEIPDYPDYGSRDEHRVRAGLMTERFPWFARVQAVGLIHAYREMVAWFDVENSPRWRPRRTGKGGSLKTYCNIYSCDFARQMTPGNRHAIPRLWWMTKAARDIRKTGIYPRPVWAETVAEVGANALADWFAEHGEAHGFTVLPATIENEPLIEEAVSKGAIGFVSCAIRRTRKAENQPMRRNGSGHITVVLPLEVAPDTEGAGLLQTQAGSTNKALFRSRWWEAGKFSPAGDMGGRRLFVYKFFSE